MKQTTISPIDNKDDVLEVEPSKFEKFKKITKEYSKEAYDLISKSIKSATVKAKEVTLKSVDTIKDKVEKTKLDQMLESDSFQLLLNYLVSDYIDAISNHKNIFKELSKEDVDRIAKRTNDIEHFKQISEYIEKVYMPIFYTNFCELIDDKKKLYKYNLAD